MGITSVDFSKFNTPAVEGGTNIPFGASDLPRQLIAGETSWNELSFTGKEDPVYKSILNSSEISSPVLSAQLNRSGSNKMEIPVLNDAKASGIPIKLAGPDGSMDLWVVTASNVNTGDLGANRTAYTIKRLYDGKEQQITAYDKNPGAGTEYAWRWGGANA
jgi:hypothetical protein